MALAKQGCHLGKVEGTTLAEKVEAQNQTRSNTLLNYAD